ncbi:unnamed protein product, partial [Medioppia subpectinata]
MYDILTGIDSQFGTLEGAVTSIVDMKLFPNLRKEILTGAICLQKGRKLASKSLLYELMTGRRTSKECKIGSTTLLDNYHIKLGIVFHATNDHKDWPPWAIALIFALILMSVLWIPGVALLRLVGVHVLADEEPSWFPAEELRQYHRIVPRKVTSFER